MLRALVPDVDRYFVMKAERNARLDLARMAVAAARYRVEHGAWPTEPPLALVDPFAGKPIRYEVKGDSLRIWSVGRNLKDDGGVSARMPIEGDIVWELPLPPRPTTRPTTHPEHQ